MESKLEKGEWILTGWCVIDCRGTYLRSKQEKEGKLSINIEEKIL